LFELFDSVLNVLLVVFYPSLYVVLKTKTGSASGPVLFTSCEMVYTTGQLNAYLIT